MPAAGIRCVIRWVPIALLSLLVTVYAEPCTQLYMKELDSTTTLHPQLAGVYKLQKLFLSEWMRGYPLYRHELDELYLYYHSSQATLMIGELQSRALLKVQRAFGAEITSEVDYSLKHLFTFSSWKEWDPRQQRYFENRNLSHMSPQCVDENFGFCSSGYLYPGYLYETTIVAAKPRNAGFEFIDLTQLYFKLLDNVFYNLRPVYEMVIESVNETMQNRITQRYLFHKNEKWQVGAEIGSHSPTSGIILEMEGNAMRVEYENKTDWFWLEFLSITAMHTRKRAFDRLQCSRKLPDGVSCHTASTVACDNGGTCQVDSSGVSSCLCAAGFRGIQCKHRVSECAESFQAPPQVSVFGSRAPHYEGSIVTVFCSSGNVEYSVCQDGSWQSTSGTICYIPTTVTTLTTTKIWLTSYNLSDDEYVVDSSSMSIATVIVVLVCVQLGFPFLCYCCIGCCRSDDEQFDDELPANDELKPVTQKHKTSLQSTCSVFFYVSWWVWLVFVIVYFVWYGSVPLDGSTVLSAVAIMAFVCLGVLYCCVFSESFCSREYNYLTELENEVVTAGEQITDMKAARPTITFRAECSHNETKTRAVNDSYGHHLETYTERVKGAVIDEPFMYTDCFDDSVDFSPPSSYVTKVQLELAVEFADDESKRVYEEAYEDFKARHLTRDEFVEFSIKNDLPGFIKTLSVHDPGHDVPTWMTSSCFCLASCLCLTWPYRLMLKSSVSSYSYRIVKKILARPVPVINQPQSIGDFPRMPETATLEPCAPPLPVIYSNDRPDDVVSIPIIPADQIPSVPPPSYEEFSANPSLFHSTKRGVLESIPLSEMKL